ncbi:MAG: PaaI family thioesterase, partial [Candidatus Rokuibacteriota bacterium]
MIYRRLTLAQTRALISRMPFNQHLGIRVARVHRDGVTVECPVREEMMNGAGVLHGGVTAALADVAVGIALNRHFGGRRRLTTVEMKVNFFRPVASGKVVARSRLIRVGSTLCVGRVELFDDQWRDVGAALVTY